MVGNEKADEYQINVISHKRVDPGGNKDEGTVDNSSEPHHPDHQHHHHHDHHHCHHLLHYSLGILQESEMNEILIRECLKRNINY